MRALVVEDEADLRRQLAARLHEDGWAVDAAADGAEGLYLGREYPFDVAVVDLGLPGLSGIELIRRLRTAQRRFPILILTARGRWQDKVEGLESGADDYLVKPFHVEELLARLKALVRRSAGWSQPVLECGPIRLDTAAKTVTVDGAAVELTTYEYRVLEQLMLRFFQKVETNGVFGNQSIMDYYEKNKASVRKITRFDIFNLQYRLPRQILQIPYDILNRINRKKLLNSNKNLVTGITYEDYFIKTANDTCFDLFYIAEKKETSEQ